MLIIVGYMLRALMIDAMGSEPAVAAIEDASAAAVDEAASELRRATEIT